MTTLTTPTTELQAVNAMLAAIGEAPINTLNQPALADASLAQSILSTVSREVQLRGWAFNREYEYPITPDINGYITVPSNCVQIKVATTMKADWDLVWRGTQMYDRQNHTNVFAQTIKFDLKVLLTFEALPEAARSYITVRAARIFIDQGVGNSEMHGYAEKDELSALAVLKEDEAEVEDFNILTDNYTVFRSLDRNAYAGYQLINP